jgi:hypothetical protein
MKEAQKDFEDEREDLSDRRKSFANYET